MASHDFSSIKSLPKFDGLNFPIWKIKIVGPMVYHPSFDDDQLMKLWLLMILCLISDRFIIKILVGA